MEFSGASLDDILIVLYKALLSAPQRNTGLRGKTVEMLGVALRLESPRARLSRSHSRGKAFSALGELLWYLARSDKLEFIEPYVKAYADEAEAGRIFGAYGPRLFSMRGSIDQIDNVTKLLQARPGSRRAVIQLFNAEDIAEDHKEVPCTTTLQFHLRDHRLHLSAMMRSNDAVKGLPHDIFCFTMIQEMMARRLGVEIGEYYHYAGSMHFYEDDLSKAQQYVAEGYHPKREMPPMPTGDQFAVVPELLKAESRIRAGERLSVASLGLEPFWSDIVRLLQVFWETGNNERLAEIRAEFGDAVYRAYLDERRQLRTSLTEQ